jgi:hypothetical protein
VTVTEQELLGEWDIYSYHILSQENGKTLEDSQVLVAGEQTYSFLEDSTCYHSYTDILTDTIIKDHYKYLVNNGTLSMWPILVNKDGMDSLDLDMEQIYNIRLMDDTLHIQYSYTGQMDYNFKSGYKLVKKQYENNK